MRYFTLIASLIIVSILTSICVAEEFPYRKDYPDINIVELEDLKKGYDNNEFIIVDVRSTLEFETIRPKNASHISISNAKFAENLKTFAAEHPNKKIAVYCNGITCLKSYKAAQEAMEAGMTNVYAFDAGIPAWADAYPADTLLLGKEIVDPEKQIIPKSEFKKLLIDFATFKEKAASPNAVVIDARDAKQRSGDLPGLENVKRIPLDKLIKNVINRGVMQNKELLIFDQVGKQVRWLMYSLVDKGYTDFYFLKSGATAVLKEQKYK